MAEHALAKAVIVARDLGQRLECRFNPTEYTVAKSANWKRTPARGAATAPRAEFVGTNPESLRMELLFDGWDSGSGDVSTDVEALMAWTNPTAASIDQNLPAPPIVFFQWGNRSLFDAYVQAVTARYVLFRNDGTPVRATAAVTFEEVPSEPARQNPTSGGQGRRAHVVSAAESLQLIAYREYGDPALWRGLAVANGIVDPLRLTPGTSLLIPPTRQAAELS